MHSIIQTTYEKIKEVKIQGATNVAIETFKAVKEWLNTTEFTSPKQLVEETLKNLKYLAEARPNEPLAKNGVRFFVHKTSLLIQQYHITQISELKQNINQIFDEYLQLISEAKARIVKYGAQIIKPDKILFTHCHSSTAESVIVEANKYLPKTVIVTETRPLYQGRITARHLVSHNIDTIMIVDSASPRFIADDSFLPVDSILIGADEILPTGDFINKVGSFSIGLAAKTYKKPLYVVTPALKLDFFADLNSVKIELRNPTEIWKNAPPGLKIINPAFDLVHHQFISGFITEFGVVEPTELASRVKQHYPWVTLTI